MTSRNILAEIVKAKTNQEVSDAKLAEVAGWSRRTFLSRWNKPETINLGELEKIAAYLGLKVSAQ